MGILAHRSILSRAAAVAFLAVTVGLVWSACRAAGGQEAAEGGLRTVRDSTACGDTEAIYTNHTAPAKELFVAVGNQCVRDTILPSGPAYVRVRKQDGTVDTTQRATVAPGRTHRGTFMMSEGWSLEVECPPGFMGCCPWRYGYTIKF